jgi:hypothetical protein
MAPLGDEHARVHISWRSAIGRSRFRGTSKTARQF